MRHRPFADWPKACSKANIYRDFVFSMDVNIKLVPEAVSLDRLQTQSQVLTKLSEDFAEVYGLEQSDIL
ncbi:MAG: hypothetical protein AAF767_09735, partial [Pseudomonadota bacterium]